MGQHHSGHLDLSLPCFSPLNTRETWINGERPEEGGRPKEKKRLKIKRRSREENEKTKGRERRKEKTERKKRRKIHRDNSTAAASSTASTPPQVTSCCPVHFPFTQPLPAFACRTWIIHVLQQMIRGLVSVIIHSNQPIWLLIWVGSDPVSKKQTLN